MKTYNKILAVIAIIIATDSFALSNQNGEDEEGKNGLFIKTFSDIEIVSSTISETNYIDFLRIHIINQPEYQYTRSSLYEKDALLRFAKRQRLPEFSGRIINDQVLERDVSDNISLRKRKDDSFDGVIELNQPIYTGGQINASIRLAQAEKIGSIYSQNNIISTLIIQANSIYLSASISDYMLTYAEKIREDLLPYQEKVRDRVNAGISDPIESAIFSIKFNEFENLYQEIKAIRKRDKDIYEYFFEEEFSKRMFPSFGISNWRQVSNKLSYEVKLAEQEFNSKKEEVTLTKSEYRPKIGLTTRYTRYDLDEDQGENDIRGGIYFSTPIFTFGRASAQISAAKASSKAAEHNIAIVKKEDEVTEKEVISAIESYLSIRNQLKNSFSDTVKQRGIILDRIDLTGFNAQLFVESSLDELIQLQKLLNTEKNLIDAYLRYLHQNQKLVSHFRLVL